MQRVALLLLGVLLPLVLLEFGLRVGGAIWTRSQDQENAARLQDDGAIRILCIGESTTAYGYPDVLERVLNENDGTPPYRVFNEGVAGTTTDEILTRLPALLDRYEPDLVVSMMGINDPKEPTRGDRLAAWIAPITSLRVFELYQLLSEHLHDRLGGVGAGPSDATEPSQETRQRIQAAEAQEKAGHLQAAHQRIVEATDADPRSYAAWRARILIDGALSRGDRASLIRPAENYFKGVLSADPSDLNARLTLARLYLDLRSYDDVRDLLLAAPPPGSDHPRWRRLLAAAYEFPSREAARREHWAVAVEHLEAGLVALPADASLIRAEFLDRLERGERARGAPATADRHLATANGLRDQLDHSFTARSYRALHRALRNRGIRLVASQYPGRSIGEVREMLDDANDVVFVDNALVFRAAVDQHGFWSVYNDEFAGDFGHMTDLGKEVLARNVAESVRGIGPP